MIFVIKIYDFLLKPLRKTNLFSLFFFEIIKRYIYNFNYFESFLPINLCLFFNGIKTLVILLISFQLLNFKIFYANLLMLDLILIILCLFFILFLHEFKSYCFFQLRCYYNYFDIYIKVDVVKNIIEKISNDTDPFFVFKNKNNFIFNNESASSFDAKDNYSKFLVFGKICEDVELILLDMNQINKFVNLFLIIFLITIIFYIFLS